MGYSNEPEWTPWGAANTAIKMMQEISKTATRGETDPFISGGLNLLILDFSPIVIIGFVLISFLWFLGKKSFHNRQK